MAERNNFFIVFSHFREINRNLSLLLFVYILFGDILRRGSDTEMADFNKRAGHVIFLKVFRNKGEKFFDKCKNIENAPKAILPFFRMFLKNKNIKII